MTAAPHPGLTAQLLALADDELILGHRDSEWCGHAPILEEDIAFANLAQDELGHAALWYRLVEQLGGGQTDALIFRREPAAYRCAQLVTLPKGDWAHAMLRQFLFDAAEAVRLPRLAESRYAPLAEAAAKIRTEEIYHLRHTRAWVRRLGLGTEESHRRMQAALDTLWPYALQLFVPLADEAELTAGGIVPEAASMRQEWEALTGEALRAAELVIPAGAEAAALSRLEQGPHMAALLEEMQAVARLEGPEGGLVTVQPEAVWEALRGVMDPELPVVSVIDMGMIRGVAVDGGRVVVALTPTFAGCPALAVMQAAVAQTVRALGADSVEVRLQLTPPWTTDWMTEAARAKLKAVGLAPPAVHGGLIQLMLTEEATCPYCGSTNTEMRNAFGPTLCRAIYYCNNCRQGFEQFKAL